MSKPVDIPFFQGQNESFDKKVLPVGPVRSAFNVRLDRDGRMVRRNRTEQRNELTPDGTFTSDRFTAHGELSVELRKEPTEAHRRTGQHVLMPDGFEYYEPRENSRVSSFASVTNEHMHGHPRRGSAILQPRVASVNNGTTIVRAAGFGEVVGDLIPTAIYPLNDMNEMCIEFLDPRTRELQHREVTTAHLSERHTVAGSNLSNTAIWMIDDEVFVYTTSPSVKLLRQWTIPGTTIGHADIIFDLETDSLIIARCTASSGDFEVGFYDLFGNVISTDTFSEAPAGTVDTRGVYAYVVRDTDNVWAGFTLNSNNPISDGALSIHYCLPGAGPSVRATNLRGACVLSGPGIAIRNGSEASFLYTQQRLTGTNELPLVTWRVLDQLFDTSGTLGTQPIYGAGQIITGPIIDAGTVNNGIRFAYQLNYARDDRAVPYEFFPDQSLSRQVVVADQARAVHANLFAGLGAQGLLITEWNDSDQAPPFRIAKMEYLPHPAEYEIEGHEFAVFPFMIQNGGGPARAESTNTWITPSPGTTPVIPYQITSVWSFCTIGGNQGRTFRTRECTFPGGSLFLDDGSHSLNCGYTGPPEIFSFEIEVVDSIGPPVPDPSAFWEAGNYFYSLVAEHIDGNGRLYRSLPSPPTKFTIETGEYPKIQTRLPMGVPSPSLRTRVFVYIGLEGGLLYKQTSIPLRSGTDSPGTIALIAKPEFGGTAEQIDGSFSPINPPDILYTDGGVLGNEAPPSCRFATRTRERLWVSGLTVPGRVQSSKIIKTGVAYEWSNLDNFFVQLPRPVTALGAIDDYCIAFCYDAIFGMSGQGPNDQGVGAFSPPQRLPGTVGCINANSLVTHETGFFFQSERGIEFMPRGFAAPTWVGQAVRDTLKAYPYCFGSCYIPSDDTIRWLFNATIDGKGSDRRVVIHDLRSKQWFVHDYGSFGFTSTPIILGPGQGQRMGTGVLEKHMAFGLQGRTSVYIEKFDKEDGTGATNVIETGSLRTAGLNGWNYGRRVNVLGEFLLDCDVTIEFAFDGKHFLPQDTFTWELREPDYIPGEAVELELSLPVQLYGSIRFRLSWTAKAAIEQGYSFYANGITVFFDPAMEGPRVPARAKG